MTNTAPPQERSARPSDPGVITLAFGQRSENIRLAGLSEFRHLALLAADALELDLSDPEQRRFGDYELLELLGEGGMGIVYRARQVGLDREVAIKLLAAGPWASREFVERFQREAQNAARMQHPNIVAIHEVGSVEELHFFSMQLVRGHSLAAAIGDEHGFEPRRAAQLMRTIAEAVDYAHSLGVLHLDLKPANVLLDESGVPHVADFGLARRLEQGMSADNEEISGTPAYMAPEQAELRAHKISAATDLWGLGAILYELVCGQPPFQAPSAQELLRLVREGRVRAPRRFASHIPRDLEAIVLKCLAREPAQRYASARALADDLGRFLDRRAVQARPLNVAQRLARWTRREPWLAAASGFVVIAIATGLVATTMQWRRAEANARHALRIRDLLVGILEDANPNHNHGKPVTAQQMLAHGATELDRPSAQDPAIQADLSSLIGLLYWELGDFADADKMIARARATYQAPGVPDAIKARTLNLFAFAENRRHKFDDAIAHAREALALAEHAGAKETASEARRFLGDSLIGKGDARNAEPLLRRTLADDRARPDEDDAEATVNDMILLGEALSSLSRFDEAIPLLREAAELETRRRGREQNAVVVALAVEASALMNSGRPAEAVPLLRETAELSGRLYGAEHRQTLVARSNLGMALQADGHYAEALQIHLGLLSAVEKLSAERPDQLAYEDRSLAGDYVGTGDFAKAEDAARQSIAIWHKIHGDADHWDSRDSLRALGAALQWQGRYADAEDALRRELALEQAHGPPTSTSLARARGDLASLLCLAHRCDEAGTLLQQALAALPASQTIIRATIQAQLATVLLENGDAASATPMSAEALTAMRQLVPASSLQLDVPLLARARVLLATNDAAQAEPLVREALSLRTRAHPETHPLVLETKALLAQALDAQGKHDEAAALRQEIEPALHALSTPYAADLLTRLK